MFAIIIKETKEILTPDVFKKYWPNYGNNCLSGWKPPKKIYETIGRAKSGFAHCPNELKKDLAIAEFVFGSIIENGEGLAVKQEERRAKKEKERTIRYEKYTLENAKKNLLKAQEELDKLNKKYEF